LKEHIPEEFKMPVNDFFAQKTAGKTKELSVSRVVRIALGGRIYLSKRLAPPMAICNGRVYSDEDYVYSGDIELPKYVQALKDIADEFGVVIRVFGESGSNAYWSSETPDLYLGYAEIEGKKVENGKIREVLPYFEAEAKKRQRRWMIDHRIVRRTPKEWINDFCLYKMYFVRRFLSKFKKK